MEVQIKYYTHYVFEAVNPNIRRFHCLENTFVSITFAIQYFNQKTLNYTLKNHFLPG